jgi:hypothetical protein
MLRMPMRLLLAQALAATIGLGGQPRALLGAQFVALQRDRLHARLERVAAEGRECGEQRREDGDATSRAMRKAGSVRVLDDGIMTWIVLNLKVHHLAHHEDAHQTSRRPRRRG